MQQNWNDAPKVRDSASPFRAESDALLQRIPDSQLYTGWLAWWYQLTMPDAPPYTAAFAIRERFRRSRIASVLTFILLVILVAALPLGLQDPATLYSLLAVLVVVIIAIVLNRSGHVYAVGILLAVAMIGSLCFVLLSGPGGRIDVDYLQLYYLLLISELFAAALLPLPTLFLIALVNSVITFASLSLQPTGPTLTALLNSPDVGLFTLAFPPVALFWAVAGVSYLLVRSAINAIARADRAEEVAELQQREVVRTRELEEGVRQLLDVHVHLANGDFRVRAQGIHDPLLWQIGNSLNNLILRLWRFAQAENMVVRSQDDARRLVEAVQIVRSGRIATWPAPSGTIMDSVTAVVRQALSEGGAGARNPAPMPQRPPMPQLPSTAPTSSAEPGRSIVPPAPLQPASEGTFPEWLRSATAPSAGQTPSAPPPGGLPRQSPQPPAGDPWSLDPNASDQAIESDLPEWLRPPQGDTNY